MSASKHDGSAPVAPAKPAPTPPSPGLPPEPLAVLRLFAEAAKVRFDSAQAAAALRRAESDVPPTAARAARQRVCQAAEALGMQVLTRRMSVREALAQVLAQSGPAALAVFAVTPEGEGHWQVVDGADAGRGRLARLSRGALEGWLDAEAIARKIGAASADAALEWLHAQPSAPLADASRRELPGGHAEEHHGPPPLTRLRGLLRAEAGDLGIVVVHAVGVGALSLAVPVTAMAVVNTTALATLVQQLVVLCAGLFVCLALAALLRVLQAVVVECLQQRLFVRLVADLSHRLPRVDVKAFDQQHGPELVNRFFDVLTIQKAVATLLLDGVTLVLQVVIGLALLAFYHQILLGFDLVLIASLLFMVFVLGRGAVRSSINESIAKYQVAGWVEELARHPVAFKFYSGPRFARERADLLSRQYLHARQAHFRVVLSQFAFALALQAATSTALLGLGGYLVIQGQLTLGQLVAAEIVVALVVASFTKLGKQLESYYDLLAAVDKIGHLTDLPLEREGGASLPPRSGGAAVRARGLRFAYTPDGPAVLDALDLAVEPGERVAILGPNGAGKSTLIDLLLGVRAPTRGFLEIDGMDLRDARLASLREQVAVVKGVEIFEGSVVDNVRMGRDDLSLAQVRQALEQVGLLGDLLDFPGGLQTLLGTGGSPLSGGQTVRLMLARALVGEPRLLVLDETLDDMDPEARHLLLPALLGPEAPWTLLVVTHRQEIAQLCGRHIVLARGGQPGQARVASPTL